MKSGTTESVKFKKLKRRLKLPECFVVGVLESLWRVTARDAPQGDIGKHDNEDIAAAIEWPDDADELVRNLVETGWLDESKEHRLVVHDWESRSPSGIRYARSLSVYFVQCGDAGPIKIGITSKDVEKRVAHLQTGSPVNLILIGSFIGRPEDEKHLHQLLQEHHIRGEWFQPHEDVFRAIKDKVASDAC